MLMSTIFSVTSLMTIIKTKKSWTTYTSYLLLMNLLIVSTYQLKYHPFALSKTLMLDSMSVLMITLSMWISSMMMLASYSMKKTKSLTMKNFLMNLMLLLVTLIMCFSFNNLLLFYIMFETSLIPTMLLIILWGNQPERKTASFYIMLYTISASLPLLIMIIKMFYTNHYTTFFFTSHALPSMNSYISWMMLIMAFMVKMPLFSLHMWLPKAHVEAPVAGSMVLAAILLKLGSYGLMRINKMINQPMFLPSYIIMSLAIIGAIITNIMCIRQTDLKALIAYSSVGHMGLLIVSSLSNSKLGQYAALMMMLTHGLTSSCLFFLTNTLYEKMNTRNIILINSLLITSPMTSLMWMLTISTNMALPPSLNLISEIIAMMSSFFISKSMIILFMSTNLTTAIYSLYLYHMINHGNQLKLTKPMSSTHSINLTLSITHIWPLASFSVLATNLMSWC